MSMDMSLRVVFSSDFTPTASELFKRAFKTAQVDSFYVPSFHSVLFVIPHASYDLKLSILHWGSHVLGSGLVSSFSVEEN